MVLSYKKGSFTQEELSWAVSLIEAEFKKKERNTPEKMSELIRENFDVKCSEHDILNFFKINEDYDRESNRIGCGYSLEPEVNSGTWTDH